MTKTRFVLRGYLSDLALLMCVKHYISLYIITYDWSDDKIWSSYSLLRARGRALQADWKSNGMWTKSHLSYGLGLYNLNHKPECDMEKKVVNR